MANDSRAAAPIIIKRKPRQRQAHAMGHWKIAYADFMTAMMAFFLLLWLVGSTTPGERNGIAEYFNSPLKLSWSGGSTVGDASHVIKGGGQDLSRAVGQVKRGDLVAKQTSVLVQSPNPSAASPVANLAIEERSQRERAEMQQLQALKLRMQESLLQSEKLAALRSQIMLDLTLDGLRVQIVDEAARPMFASASSQVLPHMRELLRALGGVLAEVPNRLALEGHTDAMPYGGGSRGFSNWELSSERANASRRELLAGGLPEDRILRVQGLAASVPLKPEDPRAAVNRRISLMVLTRQAQQRALEGATHALALPVSPSSADEVQAITRAAGLDASQAPGPVPAPQPSLSFAPAKTSQP